ncbi:MAG: hypothetical protein ABTQ73_13565 [Caldilineales bacterium]
MLNFSCTYCRAPINLSEGDLAQIMQTLGGKRPKSVPVPCPACRKSNKMPLERIRRAWQMAGSPSAPVAPTTAPDDAPAA